MTGFNARLYHARLRTRAYVAQIERDNAAGGSPLSKEVARLEQETEAAYRRQEQERKEAA
jgi:hypothetical protein